MHFAVLLALVLHAMPANALDIDAIRIRSALGQPLLADIPVNASADELASVQASLAPPVVFARVGLARPQGTVAGLRFAIVDTQEGPVVRITTDAPANEEFFSFLVQFDWSSGRMIREFSVALHASPPAAVAPPPIALAEVSTGPAPTAMGTAATTAPSPAIPVEPVTPEGVPIELVPAVPVRGTPAPSVPAPNVLAPNVPAPSVPAPSAPAPSAPRPGSSPSTPEPVQAETTPAPRSGNRERYGPVAAGETLSRIASRIDHAGSTHEQALAALLVANPHAFLGGNINRLMRGVELALPSPATIASVPEADARRLIHLHASAWAGGQADADMAMEDALALVRSRMAAVVPAVPPTGGRLEISVDSPPSADAEAGQTPGDAPRSAPYDETLASREAELRHLQERVAELEASSDDMRRIIETQDQALARAQERLAGGDRDGPALARWLKPLSAFAILIILVCVVKYGAGTASRRRQGTKKANGGAPRWHRRAVATRGSEACKDRSTTE